jgi:hypothetical protein
MSGYVGRVNLSGPPSAGGPGTALGNSFPTVASPLGDGTKADAFPGFGYERTSEDKFTGDMLRGNWEHSPLSDTFFPKENIVVIQNNIRRDVYNNSQPKGYVIDDQSVDELKIIMRGMYYQYARNLPTNIAGQVDELNKRVTAWSVPHILSAVDHYVYYLKDIDTLPVPMARPVNLTRGGSKTLPFNTFM